MASNGNAVNLSGQVAGAASTKTGVDAALWTGKKTIDLGALAPLAGSYSIAYGINDSGQVVGFWAAGVTAFQRRVRFSGSSPQKALRLSIRDSRRLPAPAQCLSHSPPYGPVRHWSPGHHQAWSVNGGDGCSRIPVTRPGKRAGATMARFNLDPRLACGQVRASL